MANRYTRLVIIYSLVLVSLIFAQGCGRDEGFYYKHYTCDTETQFCTCSLDDNNQVHVLSCTNK
jgi:hypothetical protein